MAPRQAVVAADPAQPSLHLNRLDDGAMLRIRAAPQTANERVRSTLGLSGRLPQSLVTLSRKQPKAAESSRTQPTGADRCRQVQACVGRRGQPRAGAVRRGLQAPDAAGSRGQALSSANR